MLLVIIRYYIAISSHNSVLVRRRWRRRVGAGVDVFIIADIVFIYIRPFRLISVEANNFLVNIYSLDVDRRWSSKYTYSARVVFIRRPAQVADAGRRRRPSTRKKIGQSIQIVDAGRRWEQLI